MPCPGAPCQPIFLGMNSTSTVTTIRTTPRICTITNARRWYANGRKTSMILIKYLSIPSFGMTDGTITETGPLTRTSPTVLPNPMLLLKKWDPESAHGWDLWEDMGKAAPTDGIIGKEKAECNSPIPCTTRHSPKQSQTYARGEAMTSDFSNSMGLVPNSQP